MTILAKVGGSLATYPEKLSSLCIKLSEIAKKQKLVIVPGGGEFADTVRRLDQRFTLSHTTSHSMAILGMDQYGLLLSDLTPNSCAVNSFDKITTALNARKAPIFLPSKFMLAQVSLKKSWDVTSDSIAVYIAEKLGVSKVLLITDVNGVFTADPKVDSSARLLRDLSVREILDMKKRTSVDVFLPHLLSKLSIDCFVINGLFPERVEAVLEGRETVFTLIKSQEG